jgi:exodeoxyribonuclease V alpha subunit
MSTPSESVQLRGLVERVAYHAEDTGYCILKVLPEGAREPVSLVGKAPRVVAGEQFQADGKWESTRDYGRQFRAETLKLSRPSSIEGIERYLGSGLIEGIGPSYAKRIVEKFGSRVFDIIENESVKLEGVEGIGKKRRQEIRESWLKQKSVHNIMLFLHQHGISSARALRIHKTYGDEAMAMLTRDPYRLAQDIHGIGFRTADQIARQVGLCEDAPERLQAGLLHTLDSAAQSGHTCLPEVQLLPMAAELLQSPEIQLAESLEKLIREGKIQRHALQDTSMLYLPSLRAAEQTIARRLQELIATAPSYPVIDRTQALAPSQEHAVCAALDHRCLIITGGPGVGKTTILRTVLTVLSWEKQKLVLAAPTGRAAKRLSESTGFEAKTMHRLLEYQGPGQWGRHRGKPLTGDVFVLDECSMIDTTLLAQFLSALPANAHLLLVGDADQLPSTAHQINRGQVPDLRPLRDADFFFLEAQEPEQIAATLTDLVQRRLPRKYGFDPVRDIQVLTPMNRGELGTQVLNQRLQQALNPASEFKAELERFGVTFRAGDKVIQTHNNYDKDVFNGDLGHIVSIDTDPLRVTVRFEADRLVEYEPGELDELQLAYAMTIHKSQGSEFPCVVMPVSTQHYVLLERSLIYTGLTRARRLAILLGAPKALELAIRKQESRKRWTGLKTLL